MTKKVEERSQEQPTMDPTLAQLMQTLVSQSAALQRAQQNIAQLSGLVEKCRDLLETAEIPLPEGLLASETPKKKKKGRTRRS